MGDQIVFLCEKCDVGCVDKTVQKCEEWCGKTGTCSLEITEKAAYLLDSSFQKEV